jgi:phage terminase large subunit
MIETPEQYLARKRLELPPGADLIGLPPKLAPVFEGEAMFRGAFGGRGSAKTRSFAKMTAVRGHKWAKADRSGILLCGREFMNSLDDSSMAEVKAAIASEAYLADFYDVGKDYIRTKCGRIEYKFAGLRHNLDSIKSKARILNLWVDEAEAVSENAWQVTIPTVREEGAEIWVTWNPKRKKSATHKRFRLNPPEGSKIIELNWRDNPFFPNILNKTRLDDLKSRPETYEHVWEGGFVKALDGAYFAKQLALVRAQGRIMALNADPLLPIKAIFDIGGAGAKADAMAIWITQWVGPQIRILDYIEGQGQPLEYYANELRTRGITETDKRGWSRAIIHLPHDGVNANAVTGKRYVDHWRDAGFEAEEPVPNQGAGAAMQRIEALRRIFPALYFNNTEAVEAGLDAIGWYHEKRSDDDRNIGLGPDHDWSSHAADALGLLAIIYEAPYAPTPRARYSASRRSGSGSWESA